MRPDRQGDQRHLSGRRMGSRRGRLVMIVASVVATLGLGQWAVSRTLETRHFSRATWAIIQVTGSVRPVTVPDKSVAAARGDGVDGRVMYTSCEADELKSVSMRIEYEDVARTPENAKTILDGVRRAPSSSSFGAPPSTDETDRPTEWDRFWRSNGDDWTVKVAGSFSIRASRQDSGTVIVSISTRCLTHGW